MRSAKTRSSHVSTKRSGSLALPRPTASKVASEARSSAPKHSDQLERKYARLTQKYLVAVRKLAAHSKKRMVTFQLGWWALQSTSAALALVQSGKIAICNARFHELNRRSTGGAWRRWDSASTNSDVQFSNLWVLVSREAAAASATGQDAITRKYRRVDTDEYLEASYYRSIGGETAHTAVLIYDTTERVRAEHELERMRESLIQQERIRAIGELASGVAHDLNNTLHAMSLRLSLIEQNEVCRIQQGENIAALSRIITDAALVVGRLQDFARQRHDRPLETVDVAAVVGEAIDIVRTGIEGQSSLDGAPIRIQTDLPELPPVPALASDIRHVIVNLLLNARDAMPQGGTISIVGEVQGKRVLVRVLDDGRGIAPAHLDKIFDPFFTTKGNRGTGLGLSIAAGVLTRLGGEITAQNRPEGGAVFTLCFPIATSPSMPPPQHRASYPPPGRHILVVDDDIDNLQATKMVMELEGQDVDVAQNGSEAIARVRAGMRYDLVLCDLGMPDMNGWHVAREIQTVAPGTTVYMLTGWAQQIAQDDPRRKWVKGVLEKPMNLENLRDLLAAELMDGSLGHAHTYDLPAEPA